VNCRGLLLRFWMASKERYVALVLCVANRKFEKLVHKLYIGEQHEKGGDSHNRNRANEYSDIGNSIESLGGWTNV